MTVSSRRFGVWALRRWVLAPAMIAFTVALWVALPLLLVLAALGSLSAPGRWRAPRILWLAAVYLFLESVGLLVLLGLWLASGCGARLRTQYFEGIHYDLVQGALWAMFHQGQRVLKLRIETVGPTPDAFPGDPLLVCCRHAGPADSLTLVHALMHDYAREPRVVLRDTLAWDPLISVVLSRVPARFISPDPAVGENLEAQIGDLARNLDGNDAFVIFPEGGNFTPERRERAIAKLNSLGLHGMAARAERMTNVLAPRPGGFLAALDAAPEADILLVAHTGLDHLLTVGDIWRELPMDKRITMGWWRVRRAEIPPGRDERIDWLFGRWEEIDAWVAANRVERPA